MESCQRSSRRRGMSAGQLPYPNHSLVEMPDMINVPIYPIDPRKEVSKAQQKSNLNSIGLARQVILVTWFVAPIPSQVKTPRVLVDYFEKKLY